MNFLIIDLPWVFDNFSLANMGVKYSFTFNCFQGSCIDILSKKN
jgi:hypothetical protein